MIMNAMDDGILLARWRDERDGDAFAEIARRHARAVFDITRRILGERSLAEDVLQEALLDLALEPTPRPSEIGVAAWLVRFAVDRARNRRSSEIRRAARQITYARRGATEHIATDAVELESEIERALGACIPEERALLVLRLFHGWNYAQIASALSIQEGAARVRLHRALLRIRSQLCAAAARVDRGLDARSFGAFEIDEISPDRLDAAIATILESTCLQRDPAADSTRFGSKRSRLLPIVAGGILLLLCTVAVPSRVAREEATPIAPMPQSVGHPAAAESPVLAGFSESTSEIGSSAPTISGARLPEEIACANSSR